MIQSDKLQRLVDRYSQSQKLCHSSNYNESQLRTDFLDQLFLILGWDIANTVGKPTNEREVLVEEYLRSQSNENAKRPDYTFRLFSERKFFLEAKKPVVNIAVDPEPAKQIRRYGFTAKLKISVLSNFEYTAIYDCSNPVEENDLASNSRIKLYHYTELVDNLAEINRLIGRESVYTGVFDAEWSEIENKILRFSVDDLFLQQINNWRLMLAKEFLLIKPSLSEQVLNDLTQSYINSIVFLRVCEDRNLEDYESLYNFAKSKDLNSLVNKLLDSEKTYNSGLFDLLYINELLGNQNSCVWAIIEQLYFPQSTYSFSVFTSDILGNIYEVFLSERIHINEHGEIEICPKAEHVDRDVVTTPSHIIKNIIRYTVIDFCKDKTDEQILASKFADIACGSGAFLLEVFQVLQDVLIDFYVQNDRSKLQQISQHSFKLNFEVKKNILVQCIYGVDKDFNAVKACSFGLLLKLLEGETKESTSLEMPILPVITQNILYGNSLVDFNDNVKSTDIVKVNPFDIEHKFDVIVGNPPYMATEWMKSLTPLEFSIYKKKYKTAFKQFDKYFLFVERSIQLLKSDGYLGYILPSKFTKVGSAKNLRKLIADRKYLSKLVSFGSNQIFENKTTYTCLLFLKMSRQASFEYSEVKDINRWLAREDDFVTPKAYEVDTLGSDTWILEKETNQILEKMYSNSLTLGEVLDKKAIANGIQTSANNVYIHKEIKRDDKHIYFEYNGVLHHVELELTRPYFETERTGSEQFYTYKDVEANAFVIYPYEKNNNKIELVPYEKLRSNYPKMFDFLHCIKHYLDCESRSIKPEPKTPNEWYRYGRSQALENCDVPQKIIVGVLSNGYKYSIDYNQTFVSSGGTAGYSIINVSHSNPYSIYYIQALLSSKYLEWFASIYGEVFRGGFVARGTKVQTRMPIAIIDFSCEKERVKHDKIARLQCEMNELYGQITKADERTKIVLKRQFERDRIELEDLLEQLYDLGELDRKIPSVSELYGLNQTS